MAGARALGGATADDFLGAIRLALAATANLDTEHQVIEAILDHSLCPEPDDGATWPTKILVDAIRATNATISVA